MCTLLDLGLNRLHLAAYQLRQLPRRMRHQLTHGLVGAVRTASVGGRRRLPGRHDEHLLSSLLQQ
ncbi:hypothetical protein C6N75_17720 [Streptomyces solincola]|uniref:Uncharacterized protein n=1 Tax=Streptomyces solincola TaxID=2100817 RepID=A0A2S9PTX7_9ACTN|nr:hypothetical protein C6N75_17720 [Streptomyces solincola]